MLFRIEAAPSRLNKLRGLPRFRRNSRMSSMMASMSTAASRQAEPGRILAQQNTHPEPACMPTGACGAAIRPAQKGRRPCPHACPALDERPHPCLCKASSCSHSTTRTAAQIVMNTIPRMLSCRVAGPSRSAVRWTNCQPKEGLWYGSSLPAS